MRIVKALVEQGSAFSILSIAMYIRLPRAPAIQLFTKAALNFFGVGSESVEIQKYVDAPVDLDVTAVHESLLVVEPLAFFLLIGIDIL